RRCDAPLMVSVILMIADLGYLAGSRTRVRPQPQSDVPAEIRARAAVEDNESTSSNRQAGLSSRAPEADALYLKGMYFWNKRTVAGFHQAIGYFQQATTIDPSYALAYAGLANSY